jgi:subtilase family serine protease
MPRAGKLACAGGAAALAVAVCAAGLDAQATMVPRSVAPADGSVVLADSAVPFTSHTAALGDLSSATTMTIQMWLRPDMAGAQSYADAVSTPGDSLFRHFLSPDSYTARFGPSVQEASAAGAWLRTQGFTAVQADAQRDYVRATATAGAIDAAFHVTMKRYRATAQVSDGDAPLIANDRPLTVPASLVGDVLGVTGLDTAAVTVPIKQAGPPGVYPAVGGKAAAGTASECSSYWGQYMLSGLPSMFGTTTFPVVNCGYTATQYRSVYGANWANTGKGQTIAFAEAGGLVPDMFTTLQDFAKQFHLPAPAASRYQEINQQPASCATPQESTGEEQMDVESAYAMAPGASQLVVGANLCDTGDDGFQGGFNTDLAIINGNGNKPLATVVSNSWETGFDDQAADITNIETAFLTKAASVGVGMYYSADDAPCSTQPASNPYATGVGGTMLGISKTGTRLFETGATFGEAYINDNAWDINASYGLGGGQSLVFSQPSYQQGVVPASMSTPPASGSPPGQSGCSTGGTPPPPGTSPMRSSPDVSADGADGLIVGEINADGTYVNINDAGTSLSAPLVAGMVVAAQQGQAEPFGFLNPALYKLAGTPAFYDTLPVTSSDPVLWRAQVCPATVSPCEAGTMLWITDDQSPSLPGSTGLVTAKGYDNMTGVGVPNGQAFITALRELG